MNEREGQDEERARVLCEGLEPVSEQQGQAQQAGNERIENPKQPAPKKLGPEATQVLREFYEEAKAKGLQKPERDTIGYRTGSPNTLFSKKTPTE